MMSLRIQSELHIYDDLSPNPIPSLCAPVPIGVVGSTSHESPALESKRRPKCPYLVEFRRDFTKASNPTEPLLCMMEKRVRASWLGVGSDLHVERWWTYIIMYVRTPLYLP